MVDRSRNLADELDHAPSIFKNSRFPDQLIAEFVDPGLILGSRVLQRMQRQSVVTNLVDGFALLRMMADGRYSRVFEAEDTQSGRRVILKFPKPIDGAELGPVSAAG